MQANDLLEYRDKIMKAFKDSTFLSEHLKNSDDAAHDYVKGNLKDFIQKIESIPEKITLSLFNEFFQSSSPADYAKMLINIKNADENEEYVEEIKNRILNLKGRMEIRSDKEKKR